MPSCKSSSGCFTIECKRFKCPKILRTLCCCINCEEVERKTKEEIAYEKEIAKMQYDADLKQEHKFYDKFN